MATFSSVARKPGQTIKPKAVPRRNVQRNVQRAAATVESLTPDSLPQSPDLQGIPEPQTTSEKPSSGEPSSGRTTADVQTPLTPPATAEREHTPGPTVENDVKISHLHPIAASVGLASADGHTTNGISNPAISASRGQSGRQQESEPVQIPSPGTQKSVRQQDPSRASLRTPASSASARKRRKAAPQGAPSYLLSLPATDPTARAQTEIPASQENAPAPETRGRASTNDLLQQATAQFGSVSRIAGSIENRTRNLRPRTGRASGSASYLEVEDDNESPRRRRNRRSARSSAIEDIASAVVDQAVGRGRKRKRPGSEVEDPENYEIDVNTVTLSELTKDTGLGKRSATGKELEENWAEIQQQWRKGPEENRKRAYEKRLQEKRDQRNREKNASVRLEEGEELASPVATTHHATGRAIVVNGNLVLDTDTRVIPFSNNLEAQVQADANNAYDVRRINNYVNSNRIGKHAGLRSNSNRWGDEDTELFYKGLRIFGTDLEMIASLFPNRQRREIKAKYTRELKDEPEKVEESLKNREVCGIEDYAELLGYDNEDSFLKPESLQAELAETTQRMEKEATERRREENRLENAEGADEPLQSIEVDAEGNEIVRETTEGPPGAAMDERTRRINEIADAVVQDASAPAGTAARSSMAAPAAAKKTAARRTRARDTASRAGKAKKGKQTLAGQEEAIGRVGEVPR